MNERIKELAEQRGLTGPNYFISSQELEKFVLLIVRECMNLRDHEDVNPFLHEWKHLRNEKSVEQKATGWIEGTAVYRWKIKEHFGVEE